MSSSENTSRRSSVRSGFVYGLTDANWFGVVLNSPTEWSTPEMHFPDVPQTEEYDPQQSRTVATLVDEIEDSDSFKLNSPHPRLTKQQQRAQLADGRRIPALSHSTTTSSSSSSSSSSITPPHSISGQVAGTTRGRNPAVHSLAQDSKVINWLEDVSSKK